MVKAEEVTARECKGCQCKSFDRVVLINLKRRPDRLANYQKQVKEKGWPLPAAQVFTAIDGSKVGVPEGYTTGEGAWGCLRSHCRVLESAIMDGVQSLLVLEDDVCWNADCKEKLTDFLTRVPQDWDQLMLGGQHMRHVAPPQPVSPGIVRCMNTQRTHAYAIRGKAMKSLLNLWYRHTGHIDHIMGPWQANWKVYAPDPFLFGQDASHSNIRGKELPQRYWSGSSKSATAQQTVIAVVGPFRSGTSCVAGALHHLGVSMGGHLKPANQYNPKGFFESVPLAQFCRQAFLEPRMINRMTKEQRVERLRKWAQDRGGALIGAKHPSLCLMVPEMIEAWPNVRIVSVERPAAEAITSVQKAHWWRNGIANTTIPKMVAARDEAIQTAKCPVLRLPFGDVIASPNWAVDMLVQFCGTVPTAEQRQAAIDHITPTLKHHG